MNGMEWSGGDFCLTYSTRGTLEVVNQNTSEDSQNKTNKRQVSVAKGSGKKQPGKIENVYRQELLTQAKRYRKKTKHNPVILPHPYHQMLGREPSLPPLPGKALDPPHLFLASVASETFEYEAGEFVTAWL